MRRTDSRVKIAALVGTVNLRALYKIRSINFNYSYHLKCWILGSYVIVSIFFFIIVKYIYLCITLHININYETMHITMRKVAQMNYIYYNEERLKIIVVEVIIELLTPCLRRLT